jgi:hypothetical protein
VRKGGGVGESSGMLARASSGRLWFMRGGFDYDVVYDVSLVLYQAVSLLKAQILISTLFLLIID